MAKFVLATVLAISGWLILAAAHGFAAGPYPDPPPDFSHPGSALPTSPYFRPAEGTLDRPLLVIYMSFEDNPAQSDRDEAWAADRYFGARFGSVADYFDSVSDGNFNITPALESVGTANNGIVRFDFSAGVITFSELAGDQDGDGDVDGDDDDDRMGLVLQLADPFVDFDAYDVNGDDVIDSKELLVVAMWPTSLGSCAGTRGVAGVGDLDGNSVRFRVSFTGTGTNNISNAHELAHQAMTIRDLYGLGSGALAIGGPTCSGAEIWWEPNSFEKLHFGWITPTVVTEDGFQRVDRYDTSNEAFLLYDPNRAVDPTRGVVDHYFLVENRVRTTVGYERNASDTGLVIWRIDESVWPPEVEAIRAVELMLPDPTIRAPGCRDQDLDGKLDEDPPGGNPIIGGLVDMDVDGDIDDDDNGTYHLVDIIAGGFDVDGNGSVTSDDDDRIGGVSIIDGRVDVDGDGLITGSDTGDPWDGVDNDGDNGILSANGLDDDGDGMVDEIQEGVDEDPVLPTSCYAGSPTDAWDPFEPRTPQRTMDRPFRDGKPSGLAVRAIGARSSSVCAYFDVLGAGVLLDTYALASGPIIGLPPGSSYDFTFPVMNTDDAGNVADIFEFDLDSPTLFSTTGPTAEKLEPKEEALTTVSVNLPPDAPAGPYPLVFRGQSTSDPMILGLSCERLEVSVNPVPQIPDPLEPNDSTATELDFSTSLPGASIRHEHLDERILSPGFSAVRSTNELWSTHIRGLNLHDRDDVDRFHVSLPDPGMPSSHPGIQECGSISVSPSSGLTEVITFTGALTIEVISPYRSGPPINAVGERVEIGGVASSGTDYSRTILCPRTKGVEDLMFSFGEILSGVRSDYPDYELRVEYKVAIERVPDNNPWLAEREVRGAGAAGSLPCAGGFLPFCEEREAISRIEVSHPLDPDRVGGCEADGCPDFYAFHWEGTADLALVFEGGPLTTFELLDEDFQVLATAGTGELPPPPPTDNLSAKAQSTASLGTMQEDGGAGAIGRSLFLSNLEPGFYVLRVSGLPDSHVLQFQPPPPGPDSDGDGLVDAFDYCSGEAEDVDGHEDADGCVDPDNDDDGVPDLNDNCPNHFNPDQDDHDADGIGTACDQVLDITIVIKPGADREEAPINVKARGLIPVAILSTELFDALALDTAELLFGPGEARIAHPNGHMEDVNLDGLADLLVHLAAEELGFTTGEQEVCVAGSAFDGGEVLGCDTISIVP